ncbi:MAG: MFS transporter [Bacteroidales bacterium]|nr:MFS transporter [Bacteroidales bacterium]MBQ9596744.1 MFS transporter [Bacteroidales bacterium]
MTLLRDSKKMRWMMLLAVSFLMFATYICSDNIFSVETRLSAPAEEGGYAITQVEYGNLAGAYSIFNVYLLMLIFGGLILDKMGIRFTGIMSSLMMVAGIAVTCLSFYQLRDLLDSGAEIPMISLLGDKMRAPVFWAVMGIGVFGVGAEIAGITVTKVIAKWFMGYELALAMGLQLALARLGTGIAFGATPFIVTETGGNVGLAILIGLCILTLGFIVFVVYTIFDKKLDNQLKAAGAAQEGASAEEEFHFKDIVEVFKNPAFWLIAVLCLLFYAAVNPFLKYSTGMMVDKFHMSQELAGLFPMILPMGCIVLTPLFGGIYDKKGHGADLMIAGAILITCVHLLFSAPFVNQPWMAIILMVLLGVGFAMLPSAMWPSIAKIMPAKLLGTTMALTFYIQNIGFLFVPKIISSIKESSGNNYTAMMFFFAGLGIVALLISMSVKLLDKKKHYGLQLPNIKK